MRSWPVWVLGNAITSRMSLVPTRSMTSRSSPKAIPPWGGCHTVRQGSHFGGVSVKPKEFKDLGLDGLVVDPHGTTSIRTLQTKS